jgi:hypothetical protein
MSIPINTIEELAAIANNPSGEYHLVRNLDFNDDGSYSDPANKPTYTTGEGWDPIDGFVGKFDGQGFIIRNLYSNRVADAALFKWIPFQASPVSIVIKNLRLLDVNILTANGYAGGLFVGSDTEYFLAENCLVTGTVSGDWYVGGISVYMEGGVVKNCEFQGSIYSWALAGGIAGIIQNSSAINCKADVVIPNGDIAVGGLFGYIINSDVERCVSLCNISGIQFVGALAGAMDLGNVTDCYAMGGLKTEHSNFENISGAIGVADRGNIIRCFTVCSFDLPPGTLPSVLWGEFIAESGFGADIQAGYYDSDVSGSSFSPLGTPFTTAQLQSLGAFDGWDIGAVDAGSKDTNYIWNIVDGEDYPFLSWESVSEPIPNPEIIDNPDPPSPEEPTEIILSKPDKVEEFTNRLVERKIVVGGKPYTIRIIENPTIDDIVITEMAIQANAIHNRQVLERRTPRDIRDFLIRIGVER